MQKKSIQYLVIGVKVVFGVAAMYAATQSNSMHDLVERRGVVAKYYGSGMGSTKLMHAVPTSDMSEKLSAGDDVVME